MATADLIELRAVQGLTCRAAAQQAGIANHQLQTLEDAISMPKPDHLEALAPVYNVSIDQLRRAWLNRRSSLFGTASFAQFDHPTRTYFADWLKTLR